MSRTEQTCGVLPASHQRGNKNFCFSAVVLKGPKLVTNSHVRIVNVISKVRIVN